MTEWDPGLGADQDHAMFYPGEYDEVQGQCRAPRDLHCRLGVDEPDPDHHTVIDVQGTHITAT